MPRNSPFKKFQRTYCRCNANSNNSTHIKPPSSYLQVITSRMGITRRLATFSHHGTYRSRSPRTKLSTQTGTWPQLAARIKTIEIWRTLEDLLVLIGRSPWGLSKRSWRIRVSRSTSIRSRKMWHTRCLRFTKTTLVLPNIHNAPPLFQRRKRVSRSATL